MHVKRGATDSLDLSGTGSCAAFNFRRTARAVTRLYDLGLEPSGLRATQFAILTAIAKFQPVSISRIGEILVLDPTTLTRSLGLLEKQRYLRISPRSVRRQRFLALTDSGVKALAVAVPLWRKIQSRFLAEMGGDSWPTLRNELERLAGIAVRLENSQSALSPGRADLEAKRKNQESRD
jgi:MarR family transcriptional regulator, organic hydroperoxide resistance regulator